MKITHRSGRRSSLPLLFSALLCSAGCAGETGSAPSQELVASCAPANDGLTLPEGFCAIVVADSVGRARHLRVADNGDIFVALENRFSFDGGERQSIPGGVVALRDADGDGRADLRERWGVSGGTGILLHGAYLYFGADDAVLRYPLPEGSLVPSGPPDTLVYDLPVQGGHRAKSLAIRSDGALFVNIGSPSNVCGRRRRGEPGEQPDPCLELGTTAGIWRFDVATLKQTQADGARFATGFRNTVALELHPESETLYGVVHGRDQLGAWPSFDENYNAENPAEEFATIEEGDDLGWPYCYFETESKRKILAPEYGGDGEEAGRCADKKRPLIGFPGHWAPNGLAFYTGSQFPAKYRGGAFIAFHGSWNRAPLPQAGYNVTFAPLRDGAPAGEWEVFADGFRGEETGAFGARARPVGVAMGPDGSLYVSDSRRGRIWRIIHIGP